MFNRGTLQVASRRLHVGLQLSKGNPVLPQRCHVSSTRRNELPSLKTSLFQLETMLLSQCQINQENMSALVYQIYHMPGTTPSRVLQEYVETLGGPHPWNISPPRPPRAPSPKTCSQVPTCCACYCFAVDDLLLTTKCASTFKYVQKENNMRQVIAHNGWYGPCQSFSRHAQACATRATYMYNKHAQPSRNAQNVYKVGEVYQVLL